MTAPGRGTMRCDYAGCSRPATIDIDAWAYCPDHAGRQHLDAVPPTAKPKPTVSLTAVTTQERQHGIALAGPSPIGLLLEQASGHTVAKVRRAAEKIETQLEQLRALIAEHAADEQRRRAEAAAKEKARADVARLEKQLAAAKAALRGKPAATRPSTGGPKVCTGCGAEIVRAPGQRGILPSRCTTCKAGAA